MGSPVGSVHAAGTTTFTPFGPGYLNRHIRGRKHAIDLSADGHRLGSAIAFFGVDTQSNANRQYLTSGLQWASAQGTAPLLRVAALHTESRGNQFGGQTLMRAESRLDLGDRWYMPAITGEIDQVSHTTAAGQSGLSGSAAHLGLSDDIGRGHYTAGYFRAGPQYQALGSAIAAGDRGLELSSSYDFADRYRLASTLRWHDTRFASHWASAVVQQWSFQPRARPTDIGSPWRISAQIGGPGVIVGGTRATPLALSLAAPTADWLDWRFDSSVGWYQSNIVAPEALPVIGGLWPMPITGGLWRMSMTRQLNIAGLQTRVSPNFSVGGSRYRRYGIGSRTGVAVGWPSLGDQFNLNLNYLSGGWAPAATRGDVQMTLNYNLSAGSLVPHLSSLVQRLRAPWQTGL